VLFAQNCAVNNVLQFMNVMQHLMIDHTKITNDNLHKNELNTEYRRT